MSAAKNRRAAVSEGLETLTVRRTASGDVVTLSRRKALGLISLGRAELAEEKPKKKAAKKS